MLLAVPVLSVLLGVANNLRVPEGRQVRWSGERPTVVIEAEADANRGVWTTDFVAATNAARHNNAGSKTIHHPVRPM